MRNKSLLCLIGTFFMLFSFFFIFASKLAFAEEAIVDESQVIDREENVASMQDSILVTLSSTQASLVKMTYDGQSIASGDSVASGKTLQLVLSNKANGTKVLMPKTVKVNGTSKSFTFNKKAWRETNTEYKRRMKENVDMATFSKVTASTVTISCGTLSSNTTVSVEYQELIPIYRMYNKITSEHLFTSDKAEYDKFDALCKKDKDFWIGEGIDWMAPTSGTAVYRLYNPALGKMARSSHYYTTNATERKNLKNNNGWKDDFSGKPAFYSGGSKAIYTAYNEALGSAHHLTSSLTEYKGLVQHGWDIETSKSMKNGKWNGFFKAVMGAKSDEGDTDDWSGDIVIGAYTVSENDWTNVVYYSSDGYVFREASSPFKDSKGTHIYSSADGNKHYCMTCPSIIYKDGYFWMLSSGGSWLSNGKASFVISASKDLKSWSTPWGFTASVTGSRLGDNQVAPEWFIDPDTNKVYIIQSIGNYGGFSGRGLGNDSMKPYICEVKNLKLSGFSYSKGLIYPSGLNPTFTSMSPMNSVVKAERGNSTDNLIDGCMYKENGKYYFVIKNKGLWNDVFVSTSPTSDKWTKLVNNAISYGYEAPSLTKLGKKYFLYMDGVLGTKPQGTILQTSTSISKGWSGAIEPVFMNSNGKKIGSRHGSCFVLKAGTAGWKQAKSALGLS